jgi:hypothetical protein
MQLSSLLFTLHAIIAAAEGRSPLGDLSLEHRRLLTFVAAQLQKGASPCLSDVTGNSEFGAPLTVSKRLRDLEAWGWVEIEQDPCNHRRRLLQLTNQAVTGLTAVTNSLRADLAPVIGLLRQP